MNRFLMLALVLLLAAAPLTAATLRNDDSCDVAQMPAATLLLPYFEVSLGDRATARTTLVSVTNTSREPQIAKVTIWTDWGFPVIDWNIYLTGYDVAALDLRDVLDGHIVPTSTSSPRGTRSLSANPRFLSNAAGACGANGQPTVIPPSLAADVIASLTVGGNSHCPDQKIGSTHAADRASGYVTIDVVATCSTTLPTDGTYINELLYDNVLTGDSIIYDANPQTGNYAGSSPLVHIRAIPEGGNAGVRTATNLPMTFYGRYMPSAAPKADRRQPLPSRFAARWMDGGASGFNTDFMIWRGVNVASCSSAQQAGHNLPFDVVTFDSRENPTTFTTQSLPTLDATNRVSMSKMPAAFSGDTVGWIYLDLDVTPQAEPAQNWVVVAQTAEGRYMAAYDATALGNGCSPRVSKTAPIAPAP
ncbi:MAG TPA: hypothetical protein VFN10_08750 [Thermoanaerobaculia bacterium]|nr:hypothetical protein [Thermoanaerobaculia bacterium]